MAGRFKGFCHFPCFQTLPPSRAPQARGEACVTVFERRSHLGPPAKGRQGPMMMMMIMMMPITCDKEEEDKGEDEEEEQGGGEGEAQTKAGKLFS